MGDENGAFSSVRQSRRVFSSLPVDVRAQDVLKRLNGAGGANPLHDAALIDDAANTIRDMLSVIRTGVDHGIIVCMKPKKSKSERAAERKAEKKAEKRAKKAARKKSGQSEIGIVQAS